MADFVICYICHTERAKALSVRVRAPHGLDYVCAKCFEKLSPRVKRSIRVT